MLLIEVRECRESTCFHRSKSVSKVGTRLVFTQEDLDAALFAQQLSSQLHMGPTTRTPR
jgi:hypothetical protein